VPITTTLYTGGHGNTVNVLGTTGQLDVVGAGALTVNLGNKGSVQKIAGGGRRHQQFLLDDGERG